MSAESEFVFDAVIGFLTSPTWNFPVRTFIEENSLVFDPDGENHEAFQEIHKRYKSMVEVLLASFLKDVGITEEQFMKACKAGSGSPQFRTMNRDVFDQMWAAEDFEVFKRFMTQKNIELQLQALQIIQQRHNVPMAMPVPYTPQGVPPPTPPGAHPSVPVAPPSVPVAMDEDAIMQEVLRRSKEEYELQRKGAKEKTAEHDVEQSLALSKEESERLKDIARREQEEMERVLKISLEAQRKQTAEVEKMRDEAKQSKSKSETKPSTQLSDVKTKSAPTPTPEESKAAPKTSASKSKALSKPEAKLPEMAMSSSLPPIAGKSNKPGAPSDKAAEWISNAKNDATSNISAPSAQSAQNTEEELKRRTEYLKQQRDKLLALKKQEREKHLTKYTEQQPKARPTSSQAARRVTAGEQIDSPASTSGGEDRKKLEMRRALAECLKREVIDNN